MTRRRISIGVVPTILLIVALTMGTVWATDGNLPAGTSISVEISAPPDGILVASPPGDITLEGTTAIGQGEPLANTLIVYVLDVSYSTVSSGEGAGCGGHQNTDGLENTILDCEIAAAKALNDQAVLVGTVGEVGVAVYGGQNLNDPADVAGAWADMQPDYDSVTGEQPTTAPDADLGGAAELDVYEVLGSAFTEDFPSAGAGVTQFTLRDIGSNGTNFAAGLQAAVDVVNASSMSQYLIVFMSDGVASTGAPVAGVSVPAGVVIRAFAVGAGSDCETGDTGTGGAYGSLNEIAAKGAEGSDCEHVANVADLPDVVPGIIESSLYGLELSINGGAPIDLSGETVPLLPLEGPDSATFSHDLPGLAPMMYEFCVTATGSDMGGEGSVTDCIDATVADITLEPTTATNELGDPNTDQTHTVTATVAAGGDGGIAGVEVAFEITSGPNMTGTVTAETDVNGEATYTYSATQGMAGLGTDMIEACFTDDLGVEACDMAEKEWVDTTPPEAECVETTNPSGKNIPKSKNPDGFYQLFAEDWVDPDPSVFIQDSGSGVVFPGPEAFESGAKIKYTQAPGTTPKMKKMGSDNGKGTIIWHILGNGDACLYATDASGNQSECVYCLVPPPPK
jgi:hypothetical protein